MIEAASAHTVGVANYAQVGYGQFGFGGNGFSVFSEWTRKCYATLSCIDGDWVRVFASAPAGTSVYRVSYRGAPGEDQHIHMYVDGDYIDETRFDPIGDWSSSWKNEFEGETWHTTSDVVGTVGDKTEFTSVQNQNSASPSWTDISNTNLNPSVPTVNRYKKEKFSSSAFRIWTDPL